MYHLFKHCSRIPSLHLKSQPSTINNAPSSNSIPCIWTSHTLSQMQHKARPINHIILQLVLTAIIQATILNRINCFMNLTRTPSSFLQAATPTILSSYFSDHQLHHHRDTICNFNTTIPDNINFVFLFLNCSTTRTSSHTNKSSISISIPTLFFLTDCINNICICFLTPLRFLYLVQWFQFFWHQPIFSSSPYLPPESVLPWNLDPNKLL